MNNKLKEHKRIKQRKQEIKNWYNDFKKELGCNRCPENHSGCLDFHHNNSTEKESTVSHAVHMGWSVDKIKKEIEKCEVLCSNCHRKLHYNE